ncbi:DUF6653 family protein [Roseibium sediminis]|uniref:DUF6653 family protein n=1 Tax=Roseibium sediminis TaxID=1775174 RepID=UPI00123D27BF|nr:DUF6653 family protein [Roseibium sediminis]
MITPRFQETAKILPVRNLPTRALTARASTTLRARKTTPPALVCTRFLLLPSACAVLWFHPDLGLFVCGGLLLSLWFWLDALGHTLPLRLSPSNWLQKATFGEMVLMNRMQVEIPDTDLKTARAFWIVAALSAATGLFAAYMNNPMILPSALGLYAASRLAYWQRMADLYERMQDAHPLYRFWSIQPVNDNAPRKARRKTA